MDQVHVCVLLTNHRETVLARLGQLDASHIHRYETEALIDTGATRCILPSAVADRLGLVRLGHTVAKYADGSVEEVDVTEAFTIEILGRDMVATAMVSGEQVLLGMTVLAELDLLVDCTRQRLIPHPDRPDQPVFRV